MCCGLYCGYCFGPWEQPIWECCGERAEACEVCAYSQMCMTSEKCCPNCIGGTICLSILIPLWPLSLLCDLIQTPTLCCGMRGPNAGHWRRYKGKIPTRGCGCDLDREMFKEMLLE